MLTAQTLSSEAGPIAVTPCISLARPWKGKLYHTTVKHIGKYRFGICISQMLSTQSTRSSRASSSWVRATHIGHLVREYANLFTQCNLYFQFPITVWSSEQCRTVWCRLTIICARLMQENVACKTGNKTKVKP